MKPFLLAALLAGIAVASCDPVFASGFCFDKPSCERVAREEREDARERERQYREDARQAQQDYQAALDRDALRRQMDELIEATRPQRPTRREAITNAIRNW